MGTMNKLISHIINKEFDAAGFALNEAMDDIIEHKLLEMKKCIDLSEVSKKTALKAYALSADPDDETDKTWNRLSRLGGHIRRKWGKGMLGKADDHAYNTHFGRGNIWQKEDPLSDTNLNSKRLTKSGKLNKTDAKGLKSIAKDKLDSLKKQKKLNLPEETQLDEGWYKKTLDSASKKSDKIGNWDWKKGDYSEKGRKELTTGEKIVDKIDNTKIAIGKKLRHIFKEESLEEGRHKGIGNKKKKTRLARQTQDLRNTFGVAPGKRRRQGPRTARLEESNPWSGAGEYVKAGIKNDARKISKQWKDDIGPTVKSAGKVAAGAIGRIAKKAANKVAEFDRTHPKFGMVTDTKRINENYWKEKELKRQDAENEKNPPFKPDPKGSKQHSSASLARRGKKEAEVWSKAKESLKEALHRTVRSRGLGARGGKSLLSPSKDGTKDTRKDEAAWRESIRKAQEKDDDPSTMREGREVPNPSGKKWYQGRIRREKESSSERMDRDALKKASRERKEKMHFKSKQKLGEGLGSPTTAVAFGNLMRNTSGGTGSGTDPKEKKKPEKKVKNTGLMASLRKKIYGV